MVWRLWASGSVAGARSWGSVSARAVAPLTACGALLLACESIGEQSVMVTDPGFPMGFGGGTSDTRGGFGGTTATTGRDCVPPYSERPIFSEQVLRESGAIPRVLYSWTTREQIAEIRRTRELFLLSGQAGMGRGYAFEVIDRIRRANDSTSVAATLAALLGGDLFAKIRYAWPNPWATRRAWPGEDYGDQLVQITLKESAWIAKVAGGQIQVTDLANNLVSFADALAAPQRIGAIFFAKDFYSNGPTCGFDGSTFFGGNGFGYREFILGNLGMVEEWAIGTTQIRERLVADADALKQFLAIMRPCPQPTLDFNLRACCIWAPGAANASNEWETYMGALALPSEYYGSLSEIAATIDLLRDGLFEPDPLVVRPGE